MTTLDEAYSSAIEKSDATTSFAVESEREQRNLMRAFSVAFQCSNTLEANAMSARLDRTRQQTVLTIVDDIDEQSILSVGAEMIEGSIRWSVYPLTVENAAATSRDVPSSGNREFDVPLQLVAEFLVEYITFEFGNKVLVPQAA